MTTALIIEDDLAFLELLANGWEELYKAEPVKFWEKRELRRADYSSDEQFFKARQYSYLVSKGMREMGQDDFWDYTEELLAQTLYKDHLMDSLYYAQEPFGEQWAWTCRVEQAAFDYLLNVCRRAARWALENFNRATYIRIQENARRAGSATIYGKEHFLETKDMNVSEASRHLGCDRKTVRALRKRFAHLEEEVIVDEQTGEVLEMATAKQKAYGIHLEESQNLTLSDWDHMTVKMASDRIDALLKLKAAEAGEQDWTRELYEATKETRRNTGRVNDGDTFRGHKT